MQRSFTVFIRLFCLLIFVSAGVSFAPAQDSAENNAAAETSSTASSTSPKKDSSDASDKKNELTMWGAFAPNMPTPFGGARHSAFAEAGLRYTRVLASNDSLALKYTVDFIPLAAISYEREQIFQTGPTSFFLQKTPTLAYGVGVTPVGFQLNFRNKSKLQPFLSANAGLIIFNKSIPDDSSPVFPNRFGKKLNYTLAGGGGLEYVTNSGRSYIFGFKFHHISNASTGNINPGYDQNLFWFGYTFKKW